MSNQIEQFLSQFKVLVNDLDNLRDSISEYSNQPLLFAEQEQLIYLLEELVHRVTHEEATSLAFIGQDIEWLDHFIQFRKVYPWLTDDELQQIIDSEGLSVSFKQGLSQKVPDSYSVFQHIEEIKTFWHQRFVNKSYQAIRERFKSI